MVEPRTSAPDHAAWHRRAIDDVARHFEIDLRLGLNHDEASARIGVHGRNEIVESRRRGPLAMFIGQFADFMILVLIAAAVISGLIGDVVDTLVILAIVVLNAIVGFAQEYRADRAIAALKQLAALNARVVRGGEERIIPAATLVPGDIVLLEAGNAVPADLRLVEAVQLKVEEAALTGESQPAEKVSRPLDEPDLPIGDRRNLAYKGTLVSYGRGRGIVVATGMRTELGRIAALLREAEESKTPLQKRLARFGQNIAIAVLVICAILFVTGLLRGEPVMLMLLTAISLAVAAIPEALPAVVSVSLALGARKMAVRNALVRKLPAVETLGSVTFICADKTGTLTENKMRVEEIFADGRAVRVAELSTPAAQPWSTLIQALAVSNDAQRGVDDNVIGDPTEVALFVAAEKLGLAKTAAETRLPRIGELPFDAERARMTTIHEARERTDSPSPQVKRIARNALGSPPSPSGRRDGDEGTPALTLCPLPKGEGKLVNVSMPVGRGQGVREKSTRFIAFTKGAPERVIALCHDRLSAGGATEPLDRGELEVEADRMAAEGLRVLAIAVRRWPSMPADLSAAAVETGLTLVGFVGLMDPPRPEARRAVALCQSAGITPVMITGDHPATARAIARRLGIIRDDDEVLTGRELARMEMPEFEEHVERVRVYARVAPEQKIKIVKALQDQGEFVAMTGDGVNDAPALRRADIGIAMGITGTDVAKEAGHMILLDDNFATIVTAVREGRRIFDNIRKFIKYTMTSNSGEIWTIFLAPFLGLPIPLLPIHILWINLVTDGLPGLALAAEKEERNIMSRPPRPPRESIFAHGMWQHILWVGLLMGAASLFTQAWAIHYEHGHWQTMVFTVLTLSQLGHVLAVRSEADSFFRQGAFSNRFLVGAVLCTFALQMATIYIPWLNPIFKTEALTLDELAFCLAMSAIVFIGVEIEKWAVRRGWLYRAAAARE